MTWLITGGAGYIGSHVTHAMLEAGMDCVVIDDLSSGHRGFVPEGARFVEGSLLNHNAVDEAFDGGIVGVIHLAGFKYAGESVKRPLHTYTQNVTATVALLTAMEEHDVDAMVFSSSASVYGTPDVDQVTETTPTGPESPYGQTKLIGEWLLADQAVATGLRHTSLRYFNVVGSGQEHLRDTSPHNLIPLVLGALRSGRTPKVFGTDYPTPDGTCVRDYVHVADVALAHVEAARKLADCVVLEPVYNLGAGDGTSVAQIMTTTAHVTGIDFTAEDCPRRPGDPARIVASGELAARDLGWATRHSLADMIGSAWSAENAAAPA